MTKTYIQPKMQVTHLASMMLMQSVSSGATGDMNVNTGIPTDDQW